MREAEMVFFLWFALSGWLFQLVVVAIWVLPLAAFVLIRIVAKNFVIEGACPACKQRFVGYKNQMISCRSCGNVVWKPKSNNGGGGGSGRSSNRSSSGYDDNIIDVEFEEK
ncbi:hypothetical protein GIB67_038692 [Kingdonia uniflora]|uniref:Uncharacterized protein n=1 Tax=Kingdonia uniflora TaxID=39325 RepID=A0A7J7NSM4_9MAGN|nr:hypothetical protein GIB67_038692 [Kingdonia uniflora]